MTLPTSGIMTAAMINTELGRSATANFNMNGTAERALAGRTSGSISMSHFYGKSNVPPVETSSHTLAVGGWNTGGNIYYGYSVDMINVGTPGSITPNSRPNGLILKGIYNIQIGSTGFYLQILNSQTSLVDFNRMRVGTTNMYISSASQSVSGSYRYYKWGQKTLSTGTNVTVTFSET